MTPVRVEYAAGYARLIVDRPEAYNALSPRAMDGLARAVQELADAIERPDGPRVVILAGGGGRFISGGDLKALAALRTAKAGAAMSARMQQVLDSLTSLPVPVIAAVDRFALGGGAEVMLAAHLVVASADAVVAFRHMRFAVSTAWGGAQRLVQRIGLSHARRLLWTGADVHTEEALALGLIDRVAAPGQSALAAAETWAQSLAAHPPRAMRAVSRLVAAAGDPLVDHRALEQEVFGELWADPGHWDAVDAFWTQKRSPKPLNRGRFIVLEGIDGAGTTTQAKLLRRWLERQGRRVHQTAEPSTGPLGNTLRQAMRRRLVGADGEALDPRAFAALFVADRADHLTGEIEPALARGEDVICDRYVLSSLAYQGLDADLDWVTALNAPMRAPDLTLFVDVDAEVAAQRRAGRGGVTEIYEVDDFLRRVVQAYRDVIRLRPADNVITIDGNGDVRGVHRACREAASRLPPVAAHLA
jgi:dTMP kinase